MKPVKTEVRVRLSPEELKILDNLKEILNCFHRPQVIRMLIKGKGKELYATPSITE